MSYAKKAKDKPQLHVLDGGAENRSEDKYRILFEQASDAILTLGDNSQIDNVNEAFQELTGYLKEELVGQSLEFLVPEKGTVAHPDRAKPFNPDFFKSPGTIEDAAIRHKDGVIRIVDLSVRKIQSGKSIYWMALFRDVTEKKKLERELITKHSELRGAFFQLEKSNMELKSMQDALVQAGKMAALGELAAGIAHEINQPLQGIRGYAQELESILGQKLDDESKNFLKEIVKNADKMAKIIKYLRTFTRKSTEGFEMVDVHEAIDEALKMLNTQFQSRGIEVTKNLKAKKKSVYANPVQVEQVFINLATNARDAIEEAGRGKGKIEISTNSDAQFIEILFKDDGVGMSQKTKTKLFNPFFTTKEVGKGMGLGLSLSYGLLSKIHASIVVESELGKGAAFRVRIPLDFRELP